MRERKLSDPETAVIKDGRAALGKEYNKYTNKQQQHFNNSSSSSISAPAKSFIVIDAGNLITFSLIFLCILASLDLWRQYALNSEDYWFTGYSTAVRSNLNFWKLGFHIEDLEQKISYQTDSFEAVRHAIGVLSPPLRRSTVDPFVRRRNMQSVVHQLLGNDSAIVQIRCKDLKSAEGGNILRVGFSDLRADPMDKCQIFTSTSSTNNGPHMMFEVVPLDEQAFALKNIGTDLFIQVVAPPSDGVFLPWKLVLGSWSVGAGERFRLSPEGMLYSSLIGGFLQCSSDKPVLGYPGVRDSGSQFLLEKVPSAEVYHALELADLSAQVFAIQSAYVRDKSAESAARKRTAELSVEAPDAVPEAPAKIGIAVPMTSKGTDMKDISDSPFWANLFDSFMKSIDWRSNKIVFKFFLGFDKADALYDTGDAWSDFREEFKRRASFRMTEQLMDQAAIDEVLQQRLSLKLMHFDHLEGAPTQVVSQLVLQAHSENFDFFYQVNDDTVIISPNWAPAFLKALSSNSLIPNFGVTGPIDINNDKIFTHSFVHRTHIEVFGHLFPPSFKNWWSDDWITTVYGPEHTFRLADVQIKHNVGAQKIGGSVQRYEVDMSAQSRLKEELIKGYVQVDRWLKKSNLPRLTLPSVCGYIPLVAELEKVLKEEKKVVIPKHNHIIKKTS